MPGPDIHSISPAHLDGLLAIDKPARMTSFDVVRWLRRRVQTNAIGHTGTLDPAATGLLCVCFGWAVKLIRFLDDDHKVYRGSGRLGIRTDTDDSDGRVLVECSVNVSARALSDALGRFLGTIQQQPPSYSAVKIGGTRAYVRARQGKTMALPARTVRIDAIDLESYQFGDFAFRVACGKGTYVRSLVRDLGEVLGCGAHLTQLRRLEDGAIRLEQALTLDQVETMVKAGHPLPIVPPSEMLSQLPLVRISPSTARSISQGQRPELDRGLAVPEGTPLRLTVEGSDQLLALAEVITRDDQRPVFRSIRVRPPGCDDGP